MTLEQFQPTTAALHKRLRLRPSHRLTIGPARYLAGPIRPHLPDSPIGQAQVYAMAGAAAHHAADYIAAIVFAADSHRLANAQSASSHAGVSP